MSWRDIWGNRHDGRKHARLGYTGKEFAEASKEISRGIPSTAGIADEQTRQCIEALREAVLRLAARKDEEETDEQKEKEQDSLEFPMSVKLDEETDEVALENDKETPDKMNYYGTDKDGVKGWHPFEVTVQTIPAQEDEEETPVEVWTGRSVSVNVGVADEQTNVLQATDSESGQFLQLTNDIDDEELEHDMVYGSTPTSGYARDATGEAERGWYKTNQTTGSIEGNGSEGAPYRLRGDPESTTGSGASAPPEKGKVYKITSDTGDRGWADPLTLQTESEETEATTFVSSIELDEDDPSKLVIKTSEVKEKERDNELTVIVGFDLDQSSQKILFHTKTIKLADAPADGEDVSFALMQVDGVQTGEEYDASSHELTRKYRSMLVISADSQDYEETVFVATPHADEHDIEESE